MFAVMLALGIACVAGGGVAALCWPLDHGGGRRLAVGVGVVAGLLAAGASSVMPEGRPGLSAFLPTDATIDEKSDYASSTACRSCHPGEYASWWKTYHRRMTQPVRSDNVLGSFDGQQLFWQGRRYEVNRDAGRWMVDMPAFGHDGSRPEGRWRKPVVMTTGSHHMQAYWIWAGSPATDLEREGQALFGLYCTGCHGPNGMGGEAPELLGAGLSALEVKSSILQAEKGHKVTQDISPHERAMTSARMPALDDAQRDAIEAFVGRIQFDGRLTQFPFVWLTEAQRWVHEEASFLQPEPEPYVVEPPGDRWSNSCDQCHAVGATSHWQSKDLTASSEAVDLGIACEACHGPGRQHVEHYRSPNARYSSTQPPARIINPAKLAPEASRDVCGQCHAETEPKPGPSSYTPGGRLADDLYLVQLPAAEDETPPWLLKVLDEDPDRLRGSFWADGTSRVAGRDLSAMMRSACASKGAMTCLSCHQMHGSNPDAQLKAGMEGDAACLQCHEHAAGVSLLADVEQHTHHPQDSEGSRCQNCHMPYTTYGLLQAMRSHHIDSPDPIRSMKTGRPDACTLCHLDQTLTWAETSLAEYQGRSRRRLEAPYHDVPASVLHLTQGDAVQRAVVAWHLRWPPARQASHDEMTMVPVLLPLLNDDYAAVRYLAGEALVSLPSFEELVYDFTATPEVRQQMVTNARRQYEQWGVDVKHTLKQTLGAPVGITVEQHIAALTANRDDAAVSINE